MNKLIIAALWCFSVAAYADIYVCESEMSEEIVAPNVLTGNYINKEVTKCKPRILVYESSRKMRAFGSSVFVNDSMRNVLEFKVSSRMRSKMFLHFVFVKRKLISLKRGDPPEIILFPKTS